MLGAGLLCGTALAVIIPEGVHALYEEILEGSVRHCSHLIVVSVACRTEMKYFKILYPVCHFITLPYNPKQLFVDCYELSIDILCTTF